MDNNINERKSNSNGIFLGIVSVATLIVAIIGATFAYFSATTESDNEAVSVGAYEFKLSLDVEAVAPETPKALIPLEARKTLDLGGTLGTTTYLAYAINQDMERKCIDDQGLQVCALYKITIYNDAANEVTLTGQIETTSNMPGDGETRTAFTNLTYQAVSGTPEENNMTLVGDAVTLNQKVGEKTDISDIVVGAATIDPDTGSVTKQGTGVGYVLIYLEDNEDQSAEMGATYTGKVIYSSGGTGNQLTGQFSVKGPEVDPEDEPTGEPSTEAGA